VLAAFNASDPGLKVIEMGFALLLVGWVSWRVLIVVAVIRRWVHHSRR
jgi:hypothetical protein